TQNFRLLETQHVFKRRKTFFAIRRQLGHIFQQAGLDFGFVRNKRGAKFKGVISAILLTLVTRATGVRDASAAENGDHGKEGNGKALNQDLTAQTIHKHSSFFGHPGGRRFGRLVFSNAGREKSIPKTVVYSGLSKLKTATCGNNS
ncbi:MAG: hypothetical protein ACXVA8_05445, partial [Bdellovibrionota bacterium]